MYEISFIISIIFNTKFADNITQALVKETINLFSYSNMTVFFSRLSVRY